MDGYRHMSIVWPSVDVEDSVLFPFRLKLDVIKQHRATFFEEGKWELVSESPTCLHFRARTSGLPVYIYSDGRYELNACLSEEYMRDVHASLFMLHLKETDYNAVENLDAKGRARHREAYARTGKQFYPFDD
jgi:hypothetical protein